VAHWPRTVRGNLYAIPITIAAIATLVQLVIAVSGPAVWTLAAVVCGASTVFYVWNRRVRRASDLAVADAPSFGDVLAARLANEALGAAYGGGGGG
jgi:Flp pilus assembly protein TadB